MIFLVPVHILLVRPAFNAATLTRALILLTLYHHGLQRFRCFFLMVCVYLCGGRVGGGCDF